MFKRAIKVLLSYRGFRNVLMLHLNCRCIDQKEFMTGFVFIYSIDNRSADSISIGYYLHVIVLLYYGSY